MRTFDAITGRLSHVSSGSSISGGDGNALRSWGYTYDKHNNLLTRLNYATGYDQQESFVYDDLDRLTFVQYVISLAFVLKEMQRGSECGARLKITQNSGY